MIKRMRVFSLSFVMALGLAGMAHAQTFSDSFAGFGSNTKEPIEIEAANLRFVTKTKALFSAAMLWLLKARLSLKPSA